MDIAILKQQQAAKAVFGYSNVRVYQEDEVSEHSAFGLPIWMGLEIDGFKYKIDNTKTLIGVHGINVPCCIVEVSRSKNIVKSTPIGGKITGTNKEYISLGDFQINIKGIVVSDKDSKYPEDKVTILSKIAAAPVAIPVTHKLLNLLGIYSMVIETEAYPSKQGFQNIQAFEWTCLSDSDILLKTKQTKNIKPL
jgi:hypothetical protein